MKQYEMCELRFEGPVLTGNYAAIDLEAEVSCEGDSISLKGFYAGDGIYKVRFLPKRAEPIPVMSKAVSQPMERFLSFPGKHMAW
ncbi:MAG: DUF5060 domain-containing protein [Clostridiales bacterium]|nr:DUF5060 domain-containing protein [Clostridiales bacterium]